MLISDAMVLSEVDESEEEALGVEVNALSIESGKLRSISRIQDSENDTSGVPSGLKEPDVVNSSAGAACMLEC